MSNWVKRPYIKNKSQMVATYRTRAPEADVERVVVSSHPHPRPALQPRLADGPAAVVTQRCQAPSRPNQSCSHRWCRRCPHQPHHDDWRRLPQHLEAAPPPSSRTQVPYRPSTSLHRRLSLFPSQARLALLRPHPHHRWATRADGSRQRPLASATRIHRRQAALQGPEPRRRCHECEEGRQSGHSHWLDVLRPHVMENIRRGGPPLPAQGCCRGRQSVLEPLMTGRQQRIGGLLLRQLLRQRPLQLRPRLMTGENETADWKARDHRQAVKTNLV
jgi:hypothetical protein